MLRSLLLAASILVLGACHTEPAAKVVDPLPPSVKIPPKCPKRPPAEQILVEKAQNVARKVDFGEKVVVSIGQIEVFCKNNPQSLICAGHPGGKLTLDAVRRVDADLRGRFEYTDDDLMFGTDDWWNDNTVCGDCEDYVLTLARMLGDAGQAGEAMQLAIWVPYWGGGHATLLVDTSDAGTQEISVGVGGAPQPYDVSRPVRLARVRMDGKLVVTLEPNAWFTRTAFDIRVGKSDTRPEAIAAGLLKATP